MSQQDNNIHILTNKQIAAFLSTLDCPFKIEIRPEHCKPQLQPLLLENIRAIEVGEGEYDLELTQEQAQQLADFLEADEWQGQGGDDKLA